MTSTELRCGQIWYVEGGGDYLSKGRPALILHDDAYLDLGSVTVCLFTTNSDTARDSLLRVPVSPTSENGLDRRSWLMIDKVQTVRRERLKSKLGRAEDSVVDLALERLVPFMRCPSGSHSLVERVAGVFRRWL